MADRSYDSCFCPSSLPHWKNGTSDREGDETGTTIRGALTTDLKMLALINRLLDWIKSLFWKEEMELTLVGLQYSGKTTFVNVIAVSLQLLLAALLGYG